MGKKKKKRRVWDYLSVRVTILTAALGAAFLIMTAAYAGAASAGAPAWPLLLCGGGFAILVWLYITWLFRPYKRLQQTIRLFLEGYTSMDLTEFSDVMDTPNEYLVLERVTRILDSKETLRMNKRQAQYLALQNQINPHFLYNTLESIRSEALIAGMDKVADMTEALASFFRYTISKVENLVSVEEELHNCEIYFRIQQYRFGSRLNLAIECDPEDREEIYRCRLPKLTLQPILENSIIHGTECKIGTGHLVIRMERIGECLVIQISDDGVGMDVETLRKMNERLEKSGRLLADSSSESNGGIALVNVNNRIHLLFGEEYGLHVFSMQGVGTDVEIILPAITDDQKIKKGVLS